MAIFQGYCKMKLKGIAIALIYCICLNSMHTEVYSEVSKYSKQLSMD